MLTTVDLQDIYFNTQLGILLSKSHYIRIIGIKYITVNVVPTKLIASMHVLLFPIILSIFLVSGTIGDNGIRCLEKERLVLLKIRDDFIDEYGILSTWGTEEAKKDCCKWYCVRCDNRSNHVLALDLFGPKGRTTYYYRLSGKISPSLVELEYLNHLDLSSNDFNETSIPDFMGSLAKLQHLNLAIPIFVV